jgi:hypothetical protein
MAGAHLGHNCAIGNNVIIANNCLLSGQFLQGLPYAEEAYRLASKNRTLAYELTASRMLMQLNQSLGRYKEALKYSENTGDLNTNYINELRKAEQSSIQFQQQNELAKRQYADLKRINEEKTRLLKVQRTIFWIIISSLIIVSPNPRAEITAQSPALLPSRNTTPPRSSRICFSPPRLILSCTFELLASIPFPSYFLSYFITPFLFFSCCQGGWRFNKTNKQTPKAAR